MLRGERRGGRGGESNSLCRTRGGRGKDTTRDVASSRGSPLLHSAPLRAAQCLAALTNRIRGGADRSRPAQVLRLAAPLQRHLVSGSGRVLSMAAPAPDRPSSRKRAPTILILDFHDSYTLNLLRLVHELAPWWDEQAWQERVVVINVDSLSWSVCLDCPSLLQLMKLKCRRCTGIRSSRTRYRTLTASCSALDQARPTDRAISPGPSVSSRSSETACRSLACASATRGLRRRSEARCVASHSSSGRWAEKAC